MRAILYARWSSQEQGRGSTLQRQWELGEALCRRKGWAIVERITDEGLSAYTGENLHTGNLGKLTARLEREGGTGLVIVVEKLDRLSRQPPLVMTNWMQRVCATGALLATADDRHQIDLSALMEKPFEVMNIIYEAFVGFEESRKKSERGLANWDQKRRSGRPLTSRCPAWIRLSVDRACYELIPERAAVVVWVCLMREQRIHKDRIAAMLDEQGVKPWGRGRRWYGSYIEKITRSIALVGDHQHGTKRRSDARRTMTGDVVRGYFPAVIDESLFARINDPQRRTVTNAQRRGVIANLFTGIAKCQCGSIMTLRAKGAKVRADGRVVREDYLRCDRALRPGRGDICDHRTSYNYQWFREAVLDQLLHRALDDQFFSVPDQTASQEAQVATLARRVQELDARMLAAFEMIEEDPSDELAKSRYRALKAQHSDASNQLSKAQAELSEARGSVSPGEHLARVAEVRSLMDANDPATRDEARARVKLALNGLIERCVFASATSSASLCLVGDLGLLIVRKSGGVWWFDFAKPGRDYGHLPIQERALVSEYLSRRAA